MIVSSVGCLTKYVKSVADMEAEVSHIVNTYEGEMVRLKIEIIDRRRRADHEAAIAAVKMLNRMAQNVDMDIIFEGDLSDRYHVAELCQAVSNDLFKHGQLRSGNPYYQK